MLVFFFNILTVVFKHVRWIINYDDDDAAHSFYRMKFPDNSRFSRTTSQKMQVKIMQFFQNISTKTK